MKNPNMDSNQNWKAWENKARIASTYHSRSLDWLSILGMVNWWKLKFSSFRLAGNITGQFNYRKSWHVTSRCHNPQFTEWNYAVMSPNHSAVFFTAVKIDVFNILQINSDLFFITFCHQTDKYN